jgi:hypothetical protein
MTGVFVKPLWLRGNPAARFLRKIIIGIPSELYRWLAAIRILKGMDMFIVPGTGLLTDAYGLTPWGPIPNHLVNGAKFKVVKLVCVSKNIQSICFWEHCQVVSFWTSGLIDYASLNAQAY